MYSGNKELLNLVSKGNRLDDPTNIYGEPFGGINCYLTSNNDVNKLINENNCILGDFEKSNQRILVIGNSISASFINAFEEVIKDNTSVF